MDDAELVERGSFRVDRARALDKLRRFQLGEAGFGTFFWVRCAVASGATRVELRPGLASLEVRFDGRPLTLGELRDPYGGLFAGEAPSRARHLAYGLLWALRLSPREVRLASGPPGSRLELRARGLEAEETAETHERESDTVLRLDGLWTTLLTRPWSPSTSTLAGWLGACPARVLRSGREVPRAWRDWGDARPLELPGARALMRVGRVPGRSSALVHVDGVFSGRFDYPSRYVPAESVVDAAGLALDASQSSVVRDARLDALLKELAARERDLLEPLLSSELSPEAPWARALRAAGWLVLDEAGKDRRNDLLARLWDAPVYRYSWGGPHSLAEVAARPDLDKDLVGLDADERGALSVFMFRTRRGRK